MPLELIPFEDFNVRSHIGKKLRTQARDRKYEKMSKLYRVMPYSKPKSDLNSKSSDVVPSVENKAPTLLVPKRPGNIDHI